MYYTIIILLFKAELFKDMVRYVTDVFTHQSAFPSAMLTCQDQWPYRHRVLECRTHVGKCSIGRLPVR